MYWHGSTHGNKRSFWVTRGPCRGGGGASLRPLSHDGRSDGVGMTRILVVDDEPDTTRLVSLTMERAGYEVIPCYSGKEALTLAETQTFDLILLDVMLPDLDGYEDARRLLTRDTPAPPTLFFSARCLLEDQ